MNLEREFVAYGYMPTGDCKGESSIWCHYLYPSTSLSENASFCERILLQMLIYELSTDSFQFLFRAKAYVCSLITFSFLRSKADEVVEGN